MTPEQEYEAWTEVAYALYKLERFYDAREGEADDLDYFLEEIIGDLQRAFERTPRTTTARPSGWAS